METDETASIPLLSRVKLHDCQRLKVKVILRRLLSATRPSQLMALPPGDGVLDYRDRAILKTYLYTGVRLATACRLRVRDFHQDGEEATLTISEKGNHHRTIGIHFTAAEGLSEYIAKGELTSGPLLRARL